MAEPKRKKARRRRRALRPERSTAPEPKDKRSDEWRDWKIAQLRHGLLAGAGDHESYARAWAEFRGLLYGLLADGDFWHVSHALALLPTLLSARQEIDELHARDERSRAALKGWETRRAARSRVERGLCADAGREAPRPASTQTKGTSDGQKNQHEAARRPAARRPRRSQHRKEGRAEDDKGVD